VAKITIKDIARIAGVSVSTVSLVLSGGGYVSDATRKKVEQVIAKYNYHPRQSARRLRSNMTGNIGFIISDLHLFGNEHFYTRVLLGAELEARKRDYYILLNTIGQSFSPADDIPRFIKSRDVDGIIIAGGVPHALIEYVHELKFPYVLVDYQHPTIPSNLVQIENYGGAYNAVKHLIDLGYRRIHPSRNDLMATRQRYLRLGWMRSAKTRLFMYWLTKKLQTRSDTVGSVPSWTNR
jgi:LacI family transcriptional regulator